MPKVKDFVNTPAVFEAARQRTGAPMDLGPWFDRFCAAQQETVDSWGGLTKRVTLSADEANKATERFGGHDSEGELLVTLAALASLQNTPERVSAGSLLNHPLRVYTFSQDTEVRPAWEATGKLGRANISKVVAKVCEKPNRLDLTKTQLNNKSVTQYIEVLNAKLKNKDKPKASERFSGVVVEFSVNPEDTCSMGFMPIDNNACYTAGGQGNTCPLMLAQTPGGFIVRVWNQKEPHVYTGRAYGRWSEDAVFVTNVYPNKNIPQQKRIQAYIRVALEKLGFTGWTDAESCCRGYPKDGRLRKDNGLSKEMDCKNVPLIDGTQRQPKPGERLPTCTSNVGTSVLAFKPGVDTKDQRIQDLRVLDAQGLPGIRLYGASLYTPTTKQLLFGRQTTPIWLGLDRNAYVVGLGGYPIPETAIPTGPGVVAWVENRYDKMVVDVRPGSEFYDHWEACTYRVFGSEGDVKRILSNMTGTNTDVYVPVPYLGGYARRIECVLDDNTGEWILSSDAVGGIKGRPYTLKKEKQPKGYARIPDPAGEPDSEYQNIEPVDAAEVGAQLVEAGL